MPTLREQSRNHEHQTNGVAESINHQVARHAALIMSELEDRVGTTLERDRNYLLWLPEFPAMIIGSIRKMDTPRIIESMVRTVTRSVMGFVKRSCIECMQTQRK